MTNETNTREVSDLERLSKEFTGLKDVVSDINSKVHNVLEITTAIYDALQYREANTGCSMEYFADPDSE